MAEFDFRAEELVALSLKTPVGDYLDTSKGEVWKTPLGKSIVKIVALSGPDKWDKEPFRAGRLAALYPLQNNAFSANEIKSLEKSGILRKTDPGSLRYRTQHFVLAGLYLIHLEKTMDPKAALDIVSGLVEDTNLEPYFGKEATLDKYESHAPGLFHPSSPWLSFPTAHISAELLRQAELRKIEALTSPADVDKAPVAKKTGAPKKPKENKAAEPKPVVKTSAPTGVRVSREHIPQPLIKVDQKLQQVSERVDPTPAQHYAPREEARPQTPLEYLNNMTKNDLNIARDWTVVTLQERLATIPNNYESMSFSRGVPIDIGRLLFRLYGIQIKSYENPDDAFDNMTNRQFRDMANASLNLLARHPEIETLYDLKLAFEAKLREKK